jgi:hypothetical protein
MLLIDSLVIPSYMPKNIYIYILEVFCEIVHVKKKKKKHVHYTKIKIGFVLQLSKL